MAYTDKTQTTGGLLSTGTTTPTADEGYYRNKFLQLEKTGVAGKDYNGMPLNNVEDLKKIFAASGLTPTTHYNLYGKNEGLIDPTLVPDWSWRATPPTQTTPPPATVTPSEPVPSTLEAIKAAAAAYTPVSIYKASEPYTPTPAETVEGRMEGLLKKGSTYLDAARTRGMQYANQRGLLNTSIAAEATEKAAIEAALPIVQQDAGYMQNRSLVEQEGAIQSALSSQGSKQQAGLYGVQGQISSQLSAQEAGQAMGLSKQEAGQAMGLEQAKQEWTNYRMDVENKTKLQIAQMDISSKEKQAFEKSMSTTGETMINQIASIQQNKDIDASAKTTIIKQIQDQYLANMNTLASIYGVQVDWSPITAQQTAYEEQARAQAAKAAEPKGEWSGFNNPIERAARSAQAAIGYIR